MNGAMASAFVAGAGVSPSSMRNLISVLAISFILLFAAWILGKMIEEVNNGEMDTSKFKKIAVSIGIVLSTVSYIILKF